MTEDMMKFTKAELIEMVTTLNEQLLNEKKKKIKVSGQNYPIQPETPFKDMGKMEHGRWRFRYLTHLIENDEGEHDNLYIDSLRRNRVREMKICNEYFVDLKKADFKESEPWQKQYDDFIKLIEKEKSLIPKIPSIGLNTSGK